MACDLRNRLILSPVGNLITIFGPWSIDIGQSGAVHLEIPANLSECFLGVSIGKILIRTWKSAEKVSDIR